MRTVAKRSIVGTPTENVQLAGSNLKGVTYDDSEICYDSAAVPEWVDAADLKKN